MMPKGRYRLTDVGLDEVSLVASGDDGKARIVLAKADPNTTSQESTPDMHKVNANQHGGTGVAKKKPDQGAAGTVIDKSGMSDEQLAYLNALEEVVLEITKDDTSVDGDTDVDDDTDAGDTDDTADDYESDDDTGDEDEDDDDDDDDDEDDKVVTPPAKSKAPAKKPVKKSSILSKADPELRAYIEKMESDSNARIAKAEKAAARAHEIAKSEQKRRETDEFISKASKLSHVHGNSTELGGLLQSLHELDPAAAETVEKMFVTANARLKQSNLFTEVGKSALGGNSAISKAESLATQIKKDNPKLTREQALARAYQQDPTLYDDEMIEEG